MFQITQNGVNRLDIRLSGKLDAEEMKIANETSAHRNADCRVSRT